MTLSCDLTNLPAQFTGTTCAFSPPSITPREKGNTTTLTIRVPSTAFYSAYNVTVTAKSGSQAPVIPTVFALTVAAKIAVNPTAIASLSYAPSGSNPKPSFSVDLNVTDSPPFSGFIVGIFYNVSVLQPQGIDYSQGVLGGDANVIDECINFSCTQGQPDPRYDTNGVASLVLDTFSGQNATPPTGSSAINGELFRVTFSVVGKGFSAIHFVHQELQIPCTATLCFPFNVLHTIGYDGYFTNVDCPTGSGILCKPPNVFVTSPLRPVEFRPVTFNSTAVSQNPGGYVREYNWTLGSGQNIIYVNSPVGKYNISSNITVTFLNIGEWVVTLSVQDNFGARAYSTQTILVFRIWVDLGLSALTADNTVGVLPGTVVHLVATAFNNGVIPENSTFRLSINNRNVSTQSVVNLGPNGVATVSYNWNTAGFTPRVYRVDVSIDEIRDPITSRILENDTVILQGRLVDPNNAKVAFVQLITALPSGLGLFLGLNLPETLGLGIVLVAVAGFIFGLVKKARAPPPEPL